MTDRRSGPPLFDLMRERGQDPNAPQPTPQSPPKGPPPARPEQSPSQSPTHQPYTPEGPQVSTRQTAWDTSGGVSRAERSAAAMLDDTSARETGVRIAMSRIYLITVIVLAMLIGAWAIGYNLGLKEGKSQIEQYVRDQPVAPRSQLSSPISNPVESGESTNNSSSATQTELENTSNPPANSARDATIMSSDGFLDTDPRQLGFNYLVLATLSTEQAADAIAFMSQHGVDLIGVPSLDSGASSANNPSRYTLYSLGLAIPGNRWSAMSVDRNQHQTLIANLGVRWQRERRGGSDFTQTNWEKFER